MTTWLLHYAPLLALGLAASFYLLAAVWTALVAWPFMRDTRRAAVEGLAASNRLANLIAGFPVERAEAVLEALERLAARPPARQPGTEPLQVPLPPVGRTLEDTFLQDLAPPSASVSEDVEPV